MSLKFKLIEKVYCENIPKVLAEGWEIAKFKPTLPGRFYWFWEYWEFENQVFGSLHAMADLVAMNHYTYRTDYGEIPPCDVDKLAFCINTTYFYCDTISLFAYCGTVSLNIFGHTLEFRCEWDDSYNPPCDRDELSDFFEEWYAFLQAQTLKTKDFYQLLLDNATENLNNYQQTCKEFPTQYEEMLLFKNMILEALEAQ
jgi:hypothetical protein